MAAKLKLSKRYGLSKLDPCWREKIFASIHSDRLKLAVSVLSATGCRPSELERGVVVRACNGQLHFGIQGSKCDSETGRGQPVRVLVVENSTQWGQYLDQQLANQPGQSMRVCYDAGGVSQRLREKSREIWPRRKSLISAYSYRHFMGKSLKESSVGADIIASVLGHATDYSQAVYGRAGGGKRSVGQHGIVQASATNPIRHSPKTDRLARFIKPDKPATTPVAASTS